MAALWRGNCGVEAMAWELGKKWKLLGNIAVRTGKDAMSEFRTEHDSMGDVQVPAQAYYGAQTQRAVDNFPISGWALPDDLIHAMGLVKFAAGVANRDLGKLTGSGKNPLNDAQVQAMLDACREVAAGKFDTEFPVDVFQTGSGTSSNMNVNEVISNRAIEILGGDRSAAKNRCIPTITSTWGKARTTPSPPPFTSLWRKVSTRI